MTITRWRPLNADAMRPFWADAMSPISRMMDDFFANQRSGDMMAWGPNVDIVENPDGFEIHAELPGVKEEDVNITLDNNVLTLSGEKKQEVREENKGNYCRIERSYGRFERSFSLPNTIKAENVRASFEDGVLRITLPKAEQAKSRSIQIAKK
ncbi:Hsp20/alpha crystallin family protein [bacterium]|nr:Hsp20/alpha crystallin family protein [bacterium]MBU1983601.1 Hsp20/alpha crystallin family protein [bacterium]